MKYLLPVLVGFLGLLFGSLGVLGLLHQGRWGSALLLWIGIGLCCLAHHLYTRQTTFWQCRQYHREVMDQ